MRGGSSGMSSRNHQKASDVFRETDFLFGKTSSFERAFPNILELSVEVEEQNSNGSPIRTRRIDHRDMSEYVDCSNRFCYNGGVSVGRIIRNMVGSKATRHETELLICQGYEGSPKGRRRYRSCLHAFRVVAEVKYRSE